MTRDEYANQYVMFSDRVVVIDKEISKLRSEKEEALENIQRLAGAIAALDEQAEEKSRDLSDGIRESLSRKLDTTKKEGR